LQKYRKGSAAKCRERATLHWMHYDLSADLNSHRGNTVKKAFTLIAALSMILILIVPVRSAERLRLSSTTSTDNTGLLAYLLPKFEEKTGIKVDVIAVGTGKALKLAENGDVDVTLVHAAAREIKFVEDGYAVNRREVMANYFVIVGPDSDPAGVNSADSAEEAFRRISESGSSFVSRGDDSGTHTKERNIWKMALGSVPEGKNWYLESGKGMGETLTIADEKLGYSLSDSGSYLKYSDKVDLKMLFVKPSDLLYNPYGIMAVNPGRHPHVDHEGAMKLIGFVTSTEGQKMIGEFEDKFGNKLFTPLVRNE
jgi:tungstate transport system substrate-binding protein